VYVASYNSAIEVIRAAQSSFGASKAKFAR
jgi:hypothetical protein